MGTRLFFRLIIALFIVLGGTYGAYWIYKTIKYKREVKRTIEGEYWHKVYNYYKENPANSESIVFLGNSLTEGFDLTLFGDSNVVKRGISGDFTAGVLKRLKEITDAQPRKIFIMIGINDLVEKVPVSEVAGNYEEIIQRIREESPETKIYIQSCLPTLLHSSMITSNEDVNERVLRLNERLKILGKQYEIPYINLYPHFAENNALKAEYTTDGIHLTDEAYLIWLDEVLPYVEE